MNSPVLPSAPEALTTEEFRRKLAGLTDPHEPLDGNGSLQELWLLAIDFLSTLPEVFGEDLDRMTLWGRIASGVKSGLSKTAGHDVDYFVNAVLEHIRADASRAVANDRLTALIGRLQSLEPEEQSAWLQCLGSHLIPFLTRARVAWIERRDARQTADPGQEVSP